MAVPVISLENVKKSFTMGTVVVQALRGISFAVDDGEFLSIMGPSGSGKSTCMNMIGCLDKPTEGDILIRGKSVKDMGEDELASLRNRTIGFVFQQYFLLPNLNVLENVMLPLRYKGIDISQRKDMAVAALERMDLGNRIYHRPAELSGGQRQRVAIARATVTQPAIILADEPTGALDSETGHSVLNLFHEINEAGTTVIIVTHDITVGRSARRMIRLQDGLIVEDSRV
ncbi:MAG: ABC transporter ATP-binding protein [Spirochaetia bacterium]|nr:ABC transporter ATP-binding protein [Spirochaetia bacterium]